MTILLLIMMIAFPSPDAQKSAREWLVDGQHALGEGRAEAALEAFRKAREGGLPPQMTVVQEIRALVALGRSDEAVAQLATVPAPAGGIVAAVGAYDDLVSFRERADARVELERLRPCSSERRREFDFWVGRWNVTNEAGDQELGSSVITRRHGGCAIVEEWTSASGSSGSSLNLFDERTQKWHQFWVDASGTNWLSWDEEGNPATIRGGVVDGEMVMVAAAGTTPMARGRWKLMPDGRVRQIFETSVDGGKEWAIGFEGYYSRAPETDR